MTVLIQVSLGAVHANTAQLMGSHASCSWQQLLKLARWQAVCASLFYISLLICRAKSLVTFAVKAVFIKGSRTHYTIGY